MFYFFFSIALSLAPLLGAKLNNEIVAVLVAVLCFAAVWLYQKQSSI